MRGGLRRAIPVCAVVSLVTAGSLFWHRTPDASRATSDGVQVVTGGGTGTSDKDLPRGMITKAADRDIDAAFSDATTNPLHSAESENVTGEEPPDPTLYSDDKPWGNSWVAVDGVIQRPVPR